MALQNSSILAGSYPSYAATQVSSLVYVEALRVLSSVDNVLRNILSASSYTYIKNGDFSVIGNSFVQNITSIFSGAREYINGSRSLTSFVNLTISSLGINNIIDVTSGFVTDLVNSLNAFFAGASRLPDNIFTPLVVSDPTTVNIPGTGINLPQNPQEIIVKDKVVDTNVIRFGTETVDGVTGVGVVYFNGQTYLQSDPSSFGLWQSNWYNVTP